MAGYVDKTGLQIFYNILNSCWMNEQGVLGYNSNGNKYAVQKDASTNKLYVDVPPTPQCIDVKYEDLVSLRNNKQLVPGQHYKITDYSTRVNYVYVNHALHDFKLIVKASDVDKLSENAQACPVGTTTQIVEKETGTIIGKTTITGNQWDDVTSPPIDSSQPVYVNARKNAYCVHWTRNLNGGAIVKVNVKYDEQNITTALIPSSADMDHISEEFRKRVPFLGADIMTVGKGAHPVGSISADAYDYHYSLNSVDNNYYFTVPSSGSFIIRILINNRWGRVDTEENMVNKNDLPPIDITVTTVERTEIQVGDNYFDNSILSWDLKYSLDNDRSKFLWANTDGKGVIYYMKDDIGNEAPYDFKNILYNGRYTFDYYIDGEHFDGSVKYKNQCYNNIIKRHRDTNRNVYNLPHNIFKNTSASSKCMNNYIGVDSISNEFGDSCFGNRINIGCKRNTFGSGCSNNILNNNCTDNEFSDDCYNNTLGNACNNNIFGTSCINNTFGNECIFNEFGPNCQYNTLSNNCKQNKFINAVLQNILADACSSNEFGQYSGYNTLDTECNGNKFGTNCQFNKLYAQCDNNKFGDFCQSNTFGQASTNNTFGNYCLRMNIGKKCSYNTFATSEAGSTARSYWQSITLDDSCGYNIIWNSNTSGSYCQNYHICHGIAGISSNMNKINLAELGVGYKIHVAKNSSGQIKQFCLADLIK